MSTKKQLRMTLALSTGTNHTVSLMDPKDDLTKAAVETCLQDVIAKKAIMLGEAYPVSIKDISVQTVDSAQLACVLHRQDMMRDTGRSKTFRPVSLFVLCRRFCGWRRGTACTFRVFLVESIRFLRL